MDVALVGVGGAGLAVLHELARAAPASRRCWRVALVDDVDRLTDLTDDRTWCFWDRGDNPVEPALTRTWRSVAVVGPSGRRVLDLAPLRYAMLASADYYALVAGAVDAAGDALQVVRLPAADEVADGERRALVHTAAGSVGARWVFDSRPSPPARAAVTTLLQHFRGQVVRTDRDAFDPDVHVLMDLTVPQPSRGMAFGYCLPLDRRRALVEYTEFSREVLDDAGYDSALRAYLAMALPTGARIEAVEHVEQGVIAMSDAAYSRRVGLRLMRIGTAGGATRPSTGYTFTAMQRQARAVVADLRRGRFPIPPRPYPRRHTVMDAALLRGLAAGHVRGPQFFDRLFSRNPTPRVLDFLDGRTRPSSELALMATAPAGAMLRSGAEALALRVWRWG